MPASTIKTIDLGRLSNSLRGTFVSYDSGAPCKVCSLPVESASLSGVDICSWCDLGIHRNGQPWTDENQRAFQAIFITRYPGVHLPRSIPHLPGIRYAAMPLTNAQIPTIQVTAPPTPREAFRARNARRQEARQETTPLVARVIQYTQASEYVGQLAAVKGVIQGYRVLPNNRATFLNFDTEDWMCFCIVIFGSTATRWPVSPGALYMGKTVRVTGKIIMYRDRPEIVVNTPSQIDIIQEGERNPNVIKPGEES